MRTLQLLILSGILALATSCASVTQDLQQMKQIQSIEDISKLDTPTHDISMYPEAKENEERVVINLPELKGEENYEIELIVGKWAEVDCNHHTLMGEIKPDSVKGWGYSFYTFESNGLMAGTLMGCPDQKLENKLIQAKSTKVRYNSKLPVVVIIPEGYTVSYKLWNNLGMKTIDNN